MSLWTPDGERRVSRPTVNQTDGGGDASDEVTEGALETQFGEEESGVKGPEDLADLQRALADAPAAIVVANHCFGLFELAALHLSQQPANLGHAKLAIDALGCLVDGLTGRLDEAGPGVEAELREGLAQLRMAFVQINAAQSPAGPGLGGHR